MTSAARSGSPRLRAFRFVLGVAVLLLALWTGGGARAESGPAVPVPGRAAILLTDSPRDTLATFLRLHGDLEAAILTYRSDDSFASAARVTLLTEQMTALIDLSEVTRAARREVGIRTVHYLMDIFGRIPTPDLLALPNTEAADTANDRSFRIPGTPLRILEIVSGPRRGEFLFGPSTVQAAPRFFAAIADRPLDSRLDITSYTEFGPQLTGPLVPPGVVGALPHAVTRLWLDTPVWKILLLGAIVVALMAALGRLARALALRMPAGRIPALLVTSLLPLAIVLVAMWMLPFVTGQVNVSGNFADIMEVIQTTSGYVGYAWLFWLAVRLLCEWIIRAPHISDEGLDANLLRLLSGIIAIIGVAVILAFGGQAIGLPIVSVLTGLGIGGLAVALALRPTLENFIGGVMLYFDRPVRVGDFCTFDKFTGTVEAIGLRSTKIRATDRTVIAVPNAQFADMKIINWARCDQMLISETIGIRYETTSEQLRYLLAQMRRMFHAHPRIASDTVRVRFIGYGTGALNIGIRVYAETREWNDFFAIREDVLLRVNDIVHAAGTSLALPSHTVYMNRDPGLDTERTGAARETVQRWRRSGRLPFPRLSSEELERLENSLDYPPHGSPEAGDQEKRVSWDEFLSAPDETAPATGEAPAPERRA